MDSALGKKRLIFGKQVVYSSYSQRMVDNPMALMASEYGFRKKHAREVVT
jgi:hypothetical protein